MPLFPSAYALARRAGWTETRWFKAAFPPAYFLYKRFVEDPYHGLIARRPELLRGGHILDVGANLGYTARLFARAVSPGYRVHAFEPEASNFAILERKAAGLPITTIRAAVGASDGEVLLWRNLDHPGDHRVATVSWERRSEAAETVPQRSVDSYVAGLGEGRVAFVKIDVQGYEPAVLDGMAATLEREPELRVALEHSPADLRALGFDPEEALARLRGFRLHLLAKDGTLSAASTGDIARAAARRGYVDVLAARRSLV